MQRERGANVASKNINIQLEGVSAQVADLLRATGLDRGFHIVAAEG
jgi:hypothetical protein